MITSLTLTGSDEARRVIVNAPTDIRRVVMRVLAKKILANSKKRITAQTDLQGQAFTPRRIKKRGKMIVKMRDQLVIRSVTDSEAEIGYYKPFTGMIAARHQYGMTMTVHKADFIRQRLRQEHNRPDARHTPATREQATALLTLGFKIRSPSGGWKTPTKKWITENLTIARAGLIIKELRGQAHESWQVVIPLRSFLGISRDEQQRLLNETMASPEVQAVIARWRS